MGPSDAIDIRFCHMDLHPGNIMVHDGQVSVIIDWELAGWYTWELEVMGGTKELFDPRDLAPYVEAWDVAKDLETVITKSMPLCPRASPKCPVVTLWPACSERCKHLASHSTTTTTTTTTTMTTFKTISK